MAPAKRDYDWLGRPNDRHYYWEGQPEDFSDTLDFLTRRQTRIGTINRHPGKDGSLCRAKSIICSVGR